MITVLGVLCWLPAAALIWTLVQMGQVFTNIMGSSGTVSSETLAEAIDGTLGATMVGLCVMVPVVLGFIWHVLTRARIEGSMPKVVWVLLLVFAGPFSLPMCWHAHLYAPLPESMRG